MTEKQVLNLNTGESVTHSRYGAAKIVEVMLCMGSLFGIQIRMDTTEGQALLSMDSGMPGDTAFLEDSPRRLKLVQP